jgi:FtsZ-interacting cell division protein ZipA
VYHRLEKMASYAAVWFSLVNMSRK